MLTCPTARILSSPMARPARGATTQLSRPRKNRLLRPPHQAVATPARHLTSHSSPSCPLDVLHTFVKLPRHPYTPSKPSNAPEQLTKRLTNSHLLLNLLLPSSMKPRYIDRAPSSLPLLIPPVDRRTSTVFSLLVRRSSGSRAPSSSNRPSVRAKRGSSWTSRSRARSWSRAGC